MRRTCAWLALAGLLLAAPAALFACPGAACCRGMRSGCTGASMMQPCCAAVQSAVQPLAMPPAAVRPVAPAPLLYAGAFVVRADEGSAAFHMALAALAASPPPAAPGASNLPLLI